MRGLRKIKLFLSGEGHPVGPLMLEGMSMGEECKYIMEWPIISVAFIFKQLIK